MLKVCLDLLIGVQGESFIEWPWLLHPPLKLQMNDEVIFTAEELNQQLHKDVQNVRLIAISDGVEHQNVHRE